MNYTKKPRKKSVAHNSYLRKNKALKETIAKRYNLLIVITCLLMTVLILDLFYVQVIKNTYYINKVNQLTQNITYGSTAPRGRIYDRYGRIIVDNKPVKVIYYKHQSGIKTSDEINMAYALAEMIEVPFKDLYTVNLKEFWLKNYPELGRAKITEEEWKQLEERKISVETIEKLKIERITNEDLSAYNDLDKEAAYIYYLMNKGYSYSEKVIKKENVTDEEYALVAENIETLQGFNTKLDWERTYPYGNVFKTILGTVSTSESGIPYELKDHYLSLGYSMDDRVGTSYVEYQYESYLRGTKNKYEITKSGEYKLLVEGGRGNDIVLSIDIELQKALEEVVTNEVIKAKSEKFADYYNRSFAIITNPKTGEILAMTGKQIVTKTDGSYEIYDYTPGITTSPVVVGSVIKGASHIVGYNNGALTIGEVRNDECIKIAATQAKCSWTKLGSLNDIGALKYSSNVFQFKTAINVGGGTYRYDKPLYVNPDAFQKYRDVFEQFGLGVKTGIDLPVESLGYKGSSIQSGHLLDFAIGQYDTYTPIQLSQYIGTIANDGVRIQPHLLKAVYAPTKEGLTNLIYEQQAVVLNKVSTEKEYLDRVKQGFKEVISSSGTGYGYVDLRYNAAGKTGTSESFIDTDNDGVVDTETISNTFTAYAPYDNPSVAFTIVSPDVGHSGGRTYVNKKLSYEVTKKYFEIYQ